MTVQEHIAKLRSSLGKIERGFFLAVQTVHAKQVERIFTEGKSSDGSNIGEYDNKNELYVSPQKSPRKLRTAGKTGKSKFKNGNVHKTTYYQSYKDFRARQGRVSDKVNLVLFGQLQSDFRRAPVRVSPFVYVSRVSNEKNVKKLEGAIEKYGPKVFKLSKEERSLLTKLTTIEMQKAL